MYDMEIIKASVKALAASRKIETSDIEIALEAERAVEYGALCRNTSVRELFAESKNYTNTLVSMTLSAIQLSDKLGRVADSENGVTRTFEDGGRYQKEDTRFFIPLMRGLR